jgi:hypothetical protein
VLALLGRHRQVEIGGLGKFLWKLLKALGYVPRVLIIGTLASYGATRRGVPSRVSSLAITSG